MKTLYAACLSRLGLSHTEAAALHDVRLDTVKRWTSGRCPIPAGIWNDLQAREQQITQGAGRHGLGGYVDLMAAAHSMLTRREDAHGEIESAGQKRG